jgi:hypothetical protein
MSTMSLRLPESLHEKAREMAEREGISINQLVATALAEKLAALMTVDYLQERASRALAVETGRPSKPCSGRSRTGRRSRVTNSRRAACVRVEGAPYDVAPDRASSRFDSVTPRRTGCGIATIW